MKTEIKIPAAPNFLQVSVAGEEVKVSVTNISEEELKEVGRKWTLLLLSNSKRVIPERI